jgi:Holliday junction resolvase RusA-like endonuclease
MNFTIPIAPRTKKNSQRIVIVRGRPIIMPSKLYKDYEIECKKYVPKIECPINCPINIKCTYYMPTRRKCDLTNLLEATDDMLVHYKIIEDDNYSIIVGHDGSRVYYDKVNPRTEIEITYL